VPSGPGPDGYGGVVNLPDAASPVNWGVAADVASALVRPGPTLSRGEITDLVAALRSAGQDAVGHVERIAGMRPAGSADLGPVSRTQVVDRRTWVRANARMLAVLTSGMPTAGRPSAASRWSSGIQAGTVLATVASRVLGQFDPFTAASGAPQPGALMLVAPNLVRTERALDVVPADFRLWVCLHEQTHALQFAVAPWLTEHLRARSSALLADLSDPPDGDPATGSVLARLTGLVARRGDEQLGVEALLSPSQRAEFEELGAVMAVLEGHADVTMDEVGPDVVPSVRTIRERFDKRRDGTGPFDRLLRRLLGFDQKMAQYRDGAAFIREVRRAVGTAGANAVWDGPQNLPSPREIADPRAWVRRVHG
jgi:coenzyme F420 biosynthesis associated uncharacterized protein